MWSLWYSQWWPFLRLFQELQNNERGSIREKTEQTHEKIVNMTSEAYQLQSLWSATRCKSIHLCKYQSGQISGHQSEAPDPLQVHLQWCHSTGKSITSQVKEKSIERQKGWALKMLARFHLQTCYLFLCIWQDYCRSVLQSLASHAHLCTVNKKQCHHYSLKQYWSHCILNKMDIL